MENTTKNKKVKVAMLGTFPPAIGGIATNIQNILKSPLTNKFNFLNFQTMSKKQGTPRYSYEKIYQKICRVVLDLFRFLYFLKKNSPQLIHINTSFGIWSFWRDSVYLLTSKMFRKKVFFQIHGGELNEFWRRYSCLTKSLIKRILQTPDLTAVLSSAQKKPFIEIGLGGKVRVLPNTIDLSKFCLAKNSRADFGISHDRIVVLFVAAHFHKRKGGMDLLKAVPLVINSHKKVLFVFVGGGGEEESMINFCRKKKIQNYVKFTGYLPNDRITQLQLSSNIFAFPTYYSEGFPLVILEAMAAGLPIISTPIRAIPEVIENGDNGFLIRPKDHMALADKIIYLIENEEIRKQIGNRNIQKVREKYDLGVVAHIFRDCYQQILSKKTPALS